jgi:PKD repeat protein
MTTADVQPRFQLTVYPFISNSVKNATCYNEKDGRAEFQNTQSGFLSDVYLKDQGQNTIDSILGTVNDSSVVFNNLDQGLYFFFSNTTPNFCPSIRDTFRVLAPAEVIASFQPTNTQNALELLFENLTTGAYSFEWNFGDGETSFESQPIHKYDSAGIFTVTLKASNKNGCENITTKTIKVEPAALDQTLGVTSSSITEPFIMIEHRTLDVYIPQNSTEPVNLKVYTIQGALLYERAMGTTNFASINLSHLASSVYLVKLYVGAQYSNHKIVLP